MSIHMKKSLFSLGLISALAFVGCSSDSDNEGIILPSATAGGQSAGSSSSSSQNQIPDELEYNYEMLYYYYFYAHLDHELSEDVMDYYNSPLLDNYGYSACTIRYTDVCYMYSQMQDPFTRYYDPNYASRVYAMLNETESDVGIGAEIDSVATGGQKALVFSQVYPKSPAEKAGVKANDTLLTIDNTIPNSTKALEALLTGDEGDSIAVEVKRGSDTLTLKIEISTFQIPSVFLNYKDSIPVIHIAEFTNKTVSDSGTYGEFMDALKATEGAKATIIDLRDNPGGDVDQCNSISAELLSKGDTIIIDIETNIDSVLKGNKYEYIPVFDTVTYTAEKDGIGNGRYYVFMASDTSASCAELMLSALTVNRKSPVVGLNSYGKGIGQYVIPTVKNGLALITGLRSMDKNGDVYHTFGIAPDFEIENPDEQLAKAVELAKDPFKIEHTAGYGKENTGNFAKKARAKSNEGFFPKNRKEFYKSLSGALHNKK